MNGRVYDPTLGRFISADPNIDGVSDAQGYNRYSYVGNNPLGATDPTGFFSLKGALKIVAIIVLTVVTAGAALAALVPGMTFMGAMSAMFTVGGLTFGQAVIAGAAGGFASGFAGSLLNGGSLGDAFKAGIVGGITGALTAGIGAKFGAINSKGPWNEFERAVAHGAVGGAVEEATGGEFRHGFYSSFAGSVAGSITPSLGMGTPGDGDFGKTTLRTAFAAVVGGTTSELGGGKFANGARTAAFQHLFNAEHAGALQRAAHRTMAWLGGVRSELAGKLLDHYMDGTGTTYTLTVDEVKQVNGVPDDEGPYSALNDEKIFDRVMNGEEVSVKIMSHAGALNNGTLGQFWIEYEGKLSFSGLKMKFDGTMTYHDNYDFTIDNNSGRSTVGKIRTWYGRTFITGAEFRIDSAPVPIHLAN